MHDHRMPGRLGAPRQRTRTTLMTATIVAVLAVVTLAMPATAATQPTSMVPACSGINIRTGTSTGSAIKTSLGASAKLTVSDKVSGGAWKTVCPTAKSGSTWYRITAINGKAVKDAYGVTSLYAATGVLAAVPSATTASTDAFAADLMRLINLDRKALGKPPYLIDGRLADIARDAQFTCPTNAKKVFHGRARDMADRRYFAHEVPGCYSSGTTPFRSIEIVKRVFGYAGARSEILHWNSYGTAKTTYRLGCDINGRNCAGGSTSAPYTVTLAQRNFMSSAPHRAAEMNSYQRFGCGTAKAPGSSRIYFACLFADGGSTKPPGGPAPAPATLTLAPACSGVNMRTGTSTSSTVKVRLGTSARVTVVATVTGGHWSTTCPAAKSGAAWYRISAINGNSIKRLYGVTWLYAATGVLKKPS